MDETKIAEEFEGAELGDVRRTRRLQRVAEDLAAHPDRSVPESAETDAAVEGCYRLLNNETVTPAAILAPHQRRTIERARLHRDVLVLHDTTAFKFRGEEIRQGMGPLLAKNGVSGFYAHVAMVVDPTELRDPLGVIGLHTYVRSKKKKAAAKGKQSKRLIDPDNEHHRFALLVDESERLLAGHTSPIHVIDREANIYELFDRMSAGHQRFVIRMSDDRATPERVEGTRRYEKLSDVLEGLEGIAERNVPLSRRTKGNRPPRARKIHPVREGRIAKLSFRATPVEIRRPDPVSKELAASLHLNLVHVKEVDTPEGQPPVDWKLLTTESITTVEDVLRVVDIYRARWTIEELFKALKTGCSFEKRQFRSYGALCRLLAVMLPVAWRLLRIRAAAHMDSDRPASEFLTPSMLAVLIATSKRVVLPPDPTVSQALLAIAGIGGHLKRNGRPGWRTLGNGFDTLLDRELGYLAAQGTEM